MSGPIVRKYGFPNFEKIFGEKGLQHGAEEKPETPPAPTPAQAQAETKTEGDTPPRAEKKD